VFATTVTRDAVAAVAGEVSSMPLLRQSDSRTTFKLRPSYYTFGLIWALHLSILLQTPLNNDTFRFLGRNRQASEQAYERRLTWQKSLALARYLSRPFCAAANGIGFRSGKRRADGRVENANVGQNG
jgi:hypothetical protein